MYPPHDLLYLSDVSATAFKEYSLNTAKIDGDCYKNSENFYPFSSLFQFSHLLGSMRLAQGVKKFEELTKTLLSTDNNSNTFKVLPYLEAIRSYTTQSGSVFLSQKDNWG